MINESYPPALPAPDENLAHRYRRWRRSTLGSVTERVEMSAVFDLLGALAGKRVLDAGCGDGSYALEAARHGGVVTGIDLSEEMLALARARGAEQGINVDWRYADVISLPFADESFDQVVAITLLCLVPDPRAAVLELSRVLAPGGRLLVAELHRWSIWASIRRIRGWAGNAFWRGTRFWTTSALQRLFLEAGLRPGRVRGSVYYPPLGSAARLLAPVDPLLARIGVCGAALLIVEGVKST